MLNGDQEVMWRVGRPYAVYYAHYTCIAGPTPQNKSGQPGRTVATLHNISIYQSADCQFVSPYFHTNW
jgi:hypothetical protein